MLNELKLFFRSRSSNLLFSIWRLERQKEREGNSQVSCVFFQQSGNGRRIWRIGGKNYREYNNITKAVLLQLSVHLLFALVGKYTLALCRLVRKWAGTDFQACNNRRTYMLIKRNAIFYVSQCSFINTISTSTTRTATTTKLLRLVFSGLLLLVVGRADDVCC